MTRFGLLWVQFWVQSTGADLEPDEGITEKTIWHVVKRYAVTASVPNLAPHNCRRTCARLCHTAGEELEQTQFLLGHVSVETTERYLGCK
jgi:site-specific recombinase XerD